MSQPYQRYDEEFKKNIVELYKGGKSQTQLHNEYGVSHSALSKWIKQYSGIKMEDNTIMTAKQIRQLQKERWIVTKSKIWTICKDEPFAKSKI